MEGVFQIIDWGLVSASVCTTLPIEAATERLNLVLPTGVGPWHVADDPRFADGQPQPGPCEKASDRMHYLFHC
jgi:hypothetical protein